MANEFKIKKGLIVTGASGGTVVDIQGSQGQLFSVTDDLSGSIFAVSDISGVPILDVNSSGLSTFSDNVVIGSVDSVVTGLNIGEASPTIQLFDTTNDGKLLMYMQDSTAVIGTYSNHSLKLFSDSTLALTIDTSQNATFEGDITVSGGDITVSNAITGISGGSFRVKNNGGTTIATFADDLSATFAAQAFSTATSSGDASSTLTTKGYVDSLITGATIYRGAWQAGISATSSAATTASTTLTVTAAILDADGNTPDLVGAVVTGEGITGIVKVASVTSSTVYVLDTAITATATAYIFSPIYGAPDLSGVTETSGYYYICSEAGSATPNGANSEPNTWNVGDWCIYNDVSGTGQWQKIDNSSVLSGVGTGQTVALWEGPSSVTDSDTLGNAPITVSGNNTTFAGTVEAATYYKSSGTSAVLGTDTSGEVLLRPTSSISSTAQSSFTTTLATIGTDATFAGTVSTGGYLTLNSVDNIPRLIFNGSGDDFFLSNTATYFGLYNDTDSRWDIKVDGSGNTTFAGNVTAADLLTVNGDGHLFLGADGETPKIDMMYVDSTSGLGWDTRIFTGKTDDLPNGQSFPTSTIAGGFGTQYQANSDGAFFGIIPYATGNYRPIINWGDDATDTPFSFQFNGSDIVTINYVGDITAPIFSGDHQGTINTATTGTTQTAGNNSTLIATTAYADAAAAAVDPSGVYLPLTAGSGSSLTDNLYINNVDQNNVNRYGNLQSEVGFTRSPVTGNPNQWFKVVTLGGSPKRIKFSIIATGDNTNSYDNFLISTSGYGMYMHIEKLPGGKYNTSKLLSVAVINPNNGGSVEIWIKLGPVYSGTGATYVACTSDVLASATILASATTTAPTLTANDTQLDISNDNRLYATLQASRGATFGDKVGIGTNSPAAMLTVAGGDATISGNVGIGTTSTSYALDVEAGGTGDVLGDSTTAAIFRAGRQNIWFQNQRTAAGTDWNNNTFKIIAKIDTTSHQSINFVNDASYNEHIDIYTGNQVFNTRFNANGNVGIGETSPDRRLVLDGTLGTASLEIKKESDRIVYLGTGSSAAGADNTTMLLYHDDVIKVNINTVGNSYLNGGNVGIGTSGPNNLLELYKTVDSGIGPILQLTNSQYTNANNSGSSIQFRGYTVWGPGSTNPRYSEINAINGSGSVPKRIEFKFYADTDVKTPLSILQTGRVGIGTTNPDSLLHIKGADPVFIIQDTSTGTVNASSTLRLGESGAGGVLDVYWDIKQAADDLNTHLEINHSSNGNHLTILDDGNVGLGTTTPLAKLDIQGTQGQLFSVTDDLSGSIFAVADISGIPIFDVNSNGKVGINTTSANDIFDVRSSSWATRIQSTVDGSYLRMSPNQIATFNSANAGSPLYINNSSSGNIIMAGGGGNVGIGATNPSTTLDIRTDTGVLIKGATSAANGKLKFIPASGGRQYNFENDSSSFQIVDASAGSSRMYFHYNGNLGIGTTSPDFKLDVDGSIRGTKYVLNGNVSNPTSTAATIYDQASVGLTLSAHNLSIRNYDGTNMIESARFVHDKLTCAGDVIGYGSPSDIRLKENIKPIESALDKVSKLQGVTFDWKKSDSILDIKKDVGFIAQDVQKVVPELVRENSDGMLSMRHQGITPILLEAIKELKAEIEYLKKKIK